MKFFGLGVKIAAVMAITALALTGCQVLQPSGGKTQADKSAYEKIQKELIELQTYKSDATVEYKSNKGSNKYETVQQCKINGEYRIEVTAPANVAGSVTINDGKSIRQFNQRLQSQIQVSTSENQERSELFVTSFIKNYLNSNQVSISVANFGEGRCTVLEAAIPGNHPYMTTEKLWIDNATLAPVQLIVYDAQGTERIIVTYNTFEYNVPLDEKVFN